MDGTDRTVLHQGSNINYPYDLTLDIETQTLYWADQSANRIESSSVDGSNRVLLSSDSQNIYYITFFGGKLYWSDWGLDQILSSPVAAPDNITALIERLPYDPNGIQVISLEKQPTGM